MAKTARKKTKPKAAPAAQTNWMAHPLVRLCFLLCVMTCVLCALFQLGFIGRILYQVSNLLTGYAAYGVYFAVLLVGIFILMKKKQMISRRYYAGLFFLLTSACLFLGGLEYRALPANEALTHFFASATAIFRGIYSLSGFYGALLYTIFGSLFDQIGAILFALVFLIIGLLLVGISFSAAPVKAAASLVFGRGKKAEAPVLKEKKTGKSQKKQPAQTFKIIEASHEQEVSLDDLPPALPQGGKKRRKAESLKEDPVTPVKKPVQVPLLKEEDFAPAEKPEKTVEDIHAAPSTYVAANNVYENYRMPPLKLLNEPSRKGRGTSNAAHAKVQGQKLIELLRQFNVAATLKEVHIGPSVTKFEITLEPGVRVNKITSLTGDIKMALAATDIRIEAPIPGKSAVGIEVPNVQKSIVSMKEVLTSIPKSAPADQPVTALGKDLLGECVFASINRMPHLLIAGATGSGKSVCVNSIICSILLRNRPDDVKLILIDPKKVEFTPYNDVPHLLAPVITDGELANKGLQAVVKMMDSRYDLFTEYGVRNIEGFNEYIAAHPEDSRHKLPRIVVIIDELADLMLAAAKEVEQSIQRITQLARAAGIHLIVATQRPSVDVITGVIKANIPSRIAFAVSQAVDSRTILDQVGAEKLLGYGDMLYLPNGESNAQRVQGVFIEDGEVARICEYVKSQGKPMYDDVFLQLKDIALQSQAPGAQTPGDPLYEEVKNFVVQSRRASTSLIQRKFSIGYGRAARLIDILEEKGVVGPANGSKPRKILVQNTMEDLEENL